MSTEMILAIALVAMCAIFNFTMFQYIKEYRDKTNESISYTQNELFELEDKIKKKQQTLDERFSADKNELDSKFSTVADAVISVSRRCDGEFKHQRDYNRSFAKSIRRVANLAREDKNAQSTKKK